MSFFKKGLRESKRKHEKEIIMHQEAFYKILGKIDELIPTLDPSIEYTEENINDYCKEFFNRDLDSMEKFLILGKLHTIKEGVNNVEVKSELKQSKKHPDILEVMEDVRDVRINIENKLKNETEDNT